VNREEEYRTALSETLSHLPVCIQPIIVENNGARTTFLEQFTHDHRPVPVLYTDHNERSASKGVKELLDIQYVIRNYGIRNDDMVIKVTGRYRVTLPAFFQEVIDSPHDAFIKFYDVSMQTFHPMESVLGLYAMRAYLLLLWHAQLIDLSPSAEIAFARYAKRSCSRIKEMQHLGLTCIFADSGKNVEV